MKTVTVPFFISHQGCPHTCVFCDQSLISGAPGALPDDAAMLAKIAKWRATSGGKPLQVAFFGGTFTALERSVQQRLLAPLQPLLASGVLKSVRISTRPDAIERANVLWLAAQGVAVIEVGVQSMDDRVLELAGRGHGGAVSAAAIACVKDCGLVAGAQLMPGLPGDTPEISMESLRQVIAAGADFVRIYPVLVLSGTKLAELYACGCYQPPGKEEGVSTCKRLLLHALQSGIDVIRVGLQADDGLNRNSVLAGCWHPALGQLVHSELFYDLLLELIGELPVGAPVRILCHPSRVSDVIGHSRRNVLRLASRGVAVAGVSADENMPVWHLKVSALNQSFTGSVLTDLKY